MSERIVFKDPQSGQLVEVVEAVPVSVEIVQARIDEVNNDIAQAQQLVDELETLKAKVQSFDQPQPQAEAHPAPDQPQAPAPVAAPVELTQQPVPQQPETPPQAPPISA